MELTEEEKVMGQLKFLSEEDNNLVIFSSTLLENIIENLDCDKETKQRLNLALPYSEKKEEKLDNIVDNYSTCKSLVYLINGLRSVAKGEMEEESQQIYFNEAINHFNEALKNIDDINKKTEFSLMLHYFLALCHFSYDTKLANIYANEFLNLFEKIDWDRGELDKSYIVYRLRVSEFLNEGLESD